jgi:hypothetical protein
MNKLRLDIGTPPKFMQNLPIDGRGYCVPWFVQWIDGKPDFRVTSMDNLIAAIHEKRCWVCGKKLFGEMVFTIGPMCTLNRVSAEPPSHRECAQFSATACPFLTRPHMVRNESNRPENIRVVGEMVERNPGVTMLWYARRYEVFKVDGGILFRIGSPFRWEWYARGREATRAEVLESLNSGAALLREHADEEGEGEGALEVLEENYANALRYVPRA